MANKKKTYLLYSLKPDLQYSEGRSYDVKICVDEIATLPPMLRTGDKVIAYDIFTDFPSIDFMLSFFDFAMKNGIAFRVCYSELSELFSITSVAVQDNKLSDGDEKVQKSDLEFSFPVWGTRQQSRSVQEFFPSL